MNFQKFWTWFSEPIETEGKNDDPQILQMIKISDPPNLSSSANSEGLFISSQGISKKMGFYDCNSLCKPLSIINKHLQKDLNPKDSIAQP